MNYKNLKETIFIKRFTKIIAIDIGTDTIKIAAVNCKKAVGTAEKLVLKQLPPELQADGYLFNSAALAEFLKEILRTEKIKGNALAFTAAADKTALINLELPYLQTNELLEASKWEIAHQTGSNTESFCHTAVYLTKNTGVLNKVTAIVAPENLINTFKYAAASLELPLAGVFLYAAAAEQTFIKNFKDFIFCGRINSNEYVITSFANGNPLKQKVIQGIESRIHEILAGEIENIVNSQPDTEFKQLVLNDIDNTAAEFIEANSGIPVIKNDIGHSLGFAGSISEEILQHLNEFAAVIGTALAAANNNPLNLVNASKTGFNLPRWKFYRAAAVSIMVSVLMFWGWQLTEFFYLQQQLKTVENKINAESVWKKRYEEAAAVNIQLNRRLKLAADIKAQNINWNSALADISNAVPVGCWLEKIEQGETSGQLNVTGFAVNMDKAVEFSEQLAKQQANIKTEITSLKHEQLNGQNLTAFNLLLERK